MKIAIVGLGQIGGSMALKLHEIGIHPDLFDVKPKICNLLDARCEKFNAHGYDLVVLALHIPVLLEVMNKLPKENLYLDTASVKSQITVKAKELELRFVGGHPIAGNERSGPTSWDSNLFEGKPFALVDVNSTKQEKEIVEEFVKLLGSKTVWTDAKAHDLALAYTSHALYFVSKTLKKLGDPYEAFAGPGYSSMIRLAKQDPKLGEVFVKYNHQNVATVLETIADEIEKIATEVRKCGNSE